MRVRIKRQTDAHLSGGKKALFDGQAYDLPVDVAEELIAQGKAVSLETAFRELDPEPVEPEAKAVQGPPEDKAMRPQQKKRRGRGRR